MFALYGAMSLALSALWITSTGFARAGDTSSAQYDACKEHLNASDPQAIFDGDMSCMDAATQYDGKAHRAALSGNSYDRDRYRLLAGSCYIAAGELETRIGDSDDAHDDFLKGAIRLKEAVTSRYSNIARAAAELIGTATNR